MQGKHEKPIEILARRRQLMYQKREKQVSLYENPICFAMGGLLDPQNRWVKLSRIIPWDQIEEKYSLTFDNPIKGSPAKSCRMAIGSLIIKEMLQLSDEDTVAMITENPYLQFSIGLSAFTNKEPFDASTMTLFRKRLSAEMMAQINQLIIDGGQHDPDDTDPGNGGSAEEIREDTPSEPDNKGTLIVDATCAPADIHFPTDVSLLSEAREKLEGMIDTLHDAKKGHKARTYREKARKQYLQLVRNRKPRYKQIRKANRQQLNYIRRDLQIVRDKATANVEFGAKISISMTDGYSMIENADWEAFNEAGDLQGICERYKDRTGHYPERILGDKIYRNRTNLQYCEKHNIRMNGPKLGRPPKDPVLYTQQKRMERQESGERNAVEGKFGEGKRFYGLGRVMTRLQGTSEVAIHMTFLVMNLQKRLRDLLLSIFRWLLTGKMPTCTA